MKVKKVRHFETLPFQLKGMGGGGRDGSLGQRAVRVQASHVAFDEQAPKS
jgi:hypothetical protein